MIEILNPVIIKKFIIIFMMTFSLGLVTLPLAVVSRRVFGEALTLNHYALKNVLKFSILAV